MTDGSGSGIQNHIRFFSWIQIRFVLQGWILIQSMSDSIRNQCQGCLVFKEVAQRITKRR